jgi:hypothetical protein
MPTLIYEQTGQPVTVGDIVHINNRPYTVTGWAEPHKPASTGRVHVRAMSEHAYFTEYFPAVIGAGWIGRTDQQ